MSWRPLTQRLAAVPPLLVDAGLALFLGAVGAAQLASDRHPFGEGPRPGPSRSPFGGPGGGPGGPGGGPAPVGADALTYLLLGLCAASLLVRRRYPLVSLAGVTGFGAAFLARGQPAFSIQLIVLVAIYTAVADSSLSRLPSILVAVGASCVLGLAILAGDTTRTSSLWAMDAAWAAAAIFLGDSVRSRRAYAVESERSREESSRRHVSEERLQIARELHDVVGHNIALINVQAGAGAHVLYNDAEQARQTFENIRTASHDTLQELRSMVGVLREPLADGARTPTVGLAAIDQLVQAVGEAGQAIDLEVDGDRANVTGVVDVSAYRILQEALTNTIRHAPHSHVRVKVSYRDDGVALEVTNDRGLEGVAPEPGGGHGITGMRERASAIGGRFEAGPQADGGFRVAAVLPLEKGTT